MTTSQIVKGLFVLSALTLVSPAYSNGDATSRAGSDDTELTQQRFKASTVTHVHDATRAVSRHFSARSRFSS